MTEAEKPAPHHGIKLLVVLALITVLVGVDQWSKKVAIEHLMNQPPILYLGGLFRWTYATNSGAFLSLGSTLSEANRFWVLVGFNGIILSALALFLIFSRQLRWAPALALALILAGGIGNLIDRLFRGGEVVDFMHIDLRNWGVAPDKKCKVTAAQQQCKLNRAFVNREFSILSNLLEA